MVHSLLESHHQALILQTFLRVSSASLTALTSNSGETIDEAVNLGRHLQTLGIHPMLGFSKEFSDSPSEIQSTEEETINCIRASGSLQKPTFVAIKLSGLSRDN